MTALAVLLAFAALGVIVAGVASIYGPRAVADVTASVRMRAVQQTRSNLRLLEAELQTYRLLPVMLGEYPAVRAALASGRVDPALNEKLAMLAERTGADQRSAPTRHESIIFLRVAASTGLSLCLLIKFYSCTMTYD